MKRLQILAFTVIALAAAASASPDGAELRVELPLGPYVRPGRPLDVRVIGGADRVRTTGTPWALPQGDRGDEFILQMTETTSSVLLLEIERAGSVEHATLDVEVLPADAKVVGVRGDLEAPEGARKIKFPASGLPTVREGWLLLDDQPSVFPVLEPLRLPADPRLFEATAQAAQRAPRLPRDVAAAMMLLALTEIALVAVFAWRRDSSWRRAAWLAAPVAAASGFLLTGDRLPGALRAEATAIHAARWRTSLILVRVDARRAGSATFELPPNATSAAVLRYSSDDATVRTVAAGGRRVEMVVPAGQSRVFAYAIFADWPQQGIEDRFFLAQDESSLPHALNEWIGDAGFRRYEDGAGWYHFPAEMLPRARGTTVVAGLHALAQGVPPTK